MTRNNRQQTFPTSAVIPILGGEGAGSLAESSIPSCPKRGCDRPQTSDG